MVIPAIVGAALLLTGDHTGFSGDRRHVVHRWFTDPDQGQQLLVLTPADAEARERLELLRVLGIEEFPTGTTGSPIR